MSESLAPSCPPNPPRHGLTIKWDARVQEWIVYDLDMPSWHFATLLEAESFVIAECERREAGDAA